MSHAFIFFPFASRERKAGNETEPSRHWPPSYSHRCFKSSSVCVCPHPPVCVEQSIVLSPVLCFGFSSWNLVAPRPRHCFFFHQRRDCLSVLHEQLHQKYNLTAQFTLRVFLSFARSVRGRPPVFFSSVCVCVCCVRSRSGASADVGCLKVRMSGLQAKEFWKAGEAGCLCAVLCFAVVGED